MDPEQMVLGGVFTLMGAGTMLFPEIILPLSLKTFEKVNTTELSVVFRCFGAQATLCGLLILSAAPTKRFYKTLGLSMIPFFVFDYWAWEYGFATNFGALGDLAGNIVFTACSYIGWKRADEKGLEK